MNFVCEKCLDAISFVLLMILPPLKLLNLYYDHLRKLLSEKIQILPTLAEYRRNKLEFRFRIKARFKRENLRGVRA